MLRTDHGGVGAARNLALARAAGEIVTYLDVDNAWHPTYLARVVDALAHRPDAGWSVAAQLVVRPGSLPAVRDDRRDVASLARDNFVDMNALAHRRTLLDAVGGFDEDRARLGDWDLVQRLVAVAGEPVRVPAIGSVYDDRPDPRRISTSLPLHPHLAVLRDRGRGQPAKGLRVLLAEWHYPQASESYVRSDLVGLQALGAHVEVWSESGVAVPYEPDAPLHRGDLTDAIAAARPDIVLTHWLHIGAQYRPAVREAGLPMAVRGHGFDHNPAVVQVLLEDPGVVLHLFPHLVSTPHPRQRPLPVAFDQHRYPPHPDKDRRLVVRTGVGLRTKDYETFLTVAARCPDHRFVLSLCHAYLVEEQTEEVVARRDELGAPVEILVDAPVAEVADLVGRAGIYLHTHGRTHTYGMSVSIAEALGTGAYVVAPDLPGMRSYVGHAADLYRDAAGAAALIQQTAHWDADRWRTQWRGRPTTCTSTTGRPTWPRRCSTSGATCWGSGLRREGGPGPRPGSGTAGPTIAYLRRNQRRQRGTSSRLRFACTSAMISGPAAFTISSASSSRRATDPSSRSRAPRGSSGVFGVTSVPCAQLTSAMRRS